jgi:hypothetical protein
MIQASDVAVELRLIANPKSELKAFADVTVSLGDSGELAMFGWSVMGDPFQVVPPARKGKSKFFNTMLLFGPLKTIVYTKIGMTYKEALKNAGKEVI